MAALGVALGAWLVAGALAEVAERVRARPGRRGGEPCAGCGGLPRGAWGMTLAHIGLGVFVLGACFETALARSRRPRSWRLGEPHDASAPIRLRLTGVGAVDGPNYDGRARASSRSPAPAGRSAPATPERRFYPAGGQTTSQGGDLPARASSDLYVVLGERRAGAGRAGRPGWCAPIGTPGRG